MQKIKVHGSCKTSFAYIYQGKRPPEVMYFPRDRPSGTGG